MFKKIITLVIILNGVFSFSQGEANIWYFGYRAGLDFNSGSPVPLTNGLLDTHEGCATISNAVGQLLFYTDGITVWNKNHIVMPNGTGLMGHPSSTQAAVVVPKPGSSTIYYLFTTTEKGGADGFCYSEIDLSLNGGLGDVTSIKNVAIKTPVCEKLTAVKNANNTGYWVLVHGYGDNSYCAYSITTAGINFTPVISNIGIVVQTDIAAKAAGYMKFSPDGTKIISCHSKTTITELFDFNKNTGIVSNPRIVSTKESPYGVEFSQSGNVAYISTELQNGTNRPQIFQYNLTATNIPSTEVLLYTHLNSTTHQVSGALQMGPDGKIYCAGNGNLNLHVVNNPEFLGTGCNFSINSVSLGNASGDIHFSKHGLPQFIQSVFDTSINAENFCLSDTTNLSLGNTQNVISVNWNFGDGSPTQSGLSTTHIYPTSGNFTITANVTSTSGTSTFSKTIKIYETPIIANTIANQSICGNSNQTYNLAQHTNTVLGSQSSTTYGVNYYTTLQNATNHVNALNLSQNLNLGTTTFYIKVFNINNTSCSTITSFSVGVNQQPLATQPSDYYICEAAPYNQMEQFDLSTKNNGILNGQSVSVFTITYHASQYDADNGINDLPILYTNTFPQETIYTRIENNTNSACFATVSFIIKVIQQPTISAVTDFKKCDDASNNGTEIFDLSTKTTEILNGQSASAFEVRYFNSSSDATNGVNAITSPISATNNQVFYYSISVIGNNACKAISSFIVKVNALPIANSVSNYFVCDDVSNNGIEFFNLQSKNAQVLGNQNSSLFTITYHLNQFDADLRMNSLPNSYQNISNPQTIFCRIENNQNTSCYATTSFLIGVNKMPIANQPQNIEVCDINNDNSETINLAQQNNSVYGSQSNTDFSISYHNSILDANSGSNSLPLNYTCTTFPKTIFVRIFNNVSQQCYTTTSFQLISKPQPILNMVDVYSICEGSNITVSVPNIYSSYLWSTGETTNSVILTNDGTYDVTVSMDYGNITCSVTKQFTVYNSNIATISSIVTTDWSANDNTITVYAVGDGDYEFSIDGINFQDSNYFSGLEGGEYLVYVRDKKGCGTITEEVMLLSYPKFFTPNSDGYNDTWSIKFANDEQNINIYIFDRYGKLLKNIGKSPSGWDGTFNGKSMPSSDYWFLVKRANGKEYRGHFTLKR
jgi:gliding motility-associated-like protein